MIYTRNYSHGQVKPRLTGKLIHFKVNLGFIISKGKKIRKGRREWYALKNAVIVHEVEFTVVKKIALF